MTLTFNNDAIFIQEVIDEGQMNRTRIIENTIPNTDVITPLMIEKQIRDERGQSAEQAIVSNNYHNIFFLDKQLMNTSQEYLSRIKTTVE
jgi:hypothetical protein